MISGFIIYLTIQKKKGPIDFLVARLSRLLPPYWCAVILIVILEYLHAAMFHINNRNSLLDTAVNAAMIPDILKIRFLDGAFWSLFVEVKFYIIFALLWQLVDMRKHRIFYASYGILFLLANFHNGIHHLPLGETLDYFLIFWTGIAACKALNEKMPIWIYVLITLLTTVSTLGLSSTEGTALLIGIPVFSSLFLVSANLFPKYPRFSKVFFPLSRLGRVSYSYYLIHQPIGYLVLGAAAGIGVNHYVGVISALGACYGVAWLSFTYIEQLNRPIADFIMGKFEPRLAKIGNYP
jgi:peptidoglycan/LPS O-acetylase OafA/YrhL